MLRRSAVVVVMIALAGCSGARSSPQPTASASPSQDRGGIRGFDFDNRTWQLDDARYPEVPLSAGAYATGDGSASGIRVNRDGAPVFADLDGDGDDDAAVSIRYQAGMAPVSMWYLWEWTDGTARQVRWPLLTETRCGPFIDGVAAAPVVDGLGGVQVRVRIGDLSDSCAAGGTIPVTYVVGLRDGYPLRTRPRPGAVYPCVPSSFVKPVRVKPGTVARSIGDAGAPVVARAEDFDEYAVKQYAEGGSGWYFALLRRGGDETCGYIEAGQIL